MEEKQFPKSLTLLFTSPTLHSLKVQLYDFEDCHLQTMLLRVGDEFILPLLHPLTNFYLRIKSQEDQLCELFSYFESEHIDREQAISISQNYAHFTFKIQISPQTKQLLNTPTPRTQQEEMLSNKARGFLGKAREKVFQILTKQRFFKPENNYRCNLVRKKNKKNFTAFANSSGNILKSINQNMNKSTTLKSIKHIKTLDTNQSSHDIHPSLFPTTPILNKAVSVQESKANNPTTSLPIKRRSNNRPILPMNLKKGKGKGMLKNKVRFFWELQRETLADLRNQEETLNIVRQYMHTQ